MSYKIAGIDVHKKVLMVIVIDATTPEEKRGDDLPPCRVTCADYSFGCESKAWKKR